MRALVISENLGGRLDEGIRKFATRLVDGLAAHCDATGIATESGSDTDSIRLLAGGKLLRSPLLRAAVAELAPDLVVYVPSASGTLFSFMRAHSLKRAYPRAHVAMVLAQMRPHTPPVSRILRRFSPDTLFCQSPATYAYFEKLRMRPWFLPSGVDTHRFQPVSAGYRSVLRRKHGLPQGEYLVFHAGHLTAARNTGLLAQLEGVGARGVMLAGSSMGADPRLKTHLEREGVTVIDRYVERVEELYQAADAYLFPVRTADSAMEFPLSVLEAMACNLPVVAHPYGGLTLALRAGDGLTFADTDEGMLAALVAARDSTEPIDTRAQALDLTWDRVAGRLLEATDVKRDAGTFAATV